MTIHVPPVSLAERVRSVRSPGGIEAWLFEDHALPILSASIGFRGGAALDPPGKAGTALLMARLLTEGAGLLDSEGFGRALADDAIRLSFGLERDGLRARLRTQSSTVDRAFALLRLAVNEPHFAPAPLARVRSAATAGVRQSLADAGQTAHLAFFARGFAGHAYASPAAGDLASLEAIDGADVVALHRRMLTRTGLLVAVVGAIGPEALAGLLDKAFADLPEGEAAATPPVALAGLGEREVVRLDVPNAAIVLGRPGIRLDDPDFTASQVVNHCFGGGTFTARLMREVREKRGLCYAIGSGLDAAAAACTLRISTSVANARVGETLAVVADEVARLASDGIGPDELEAAKSAMIGAYGLNFDTSVSIAELLLTLQFQGRGRDWLDARNRRIAAITTEDAARAIGRLFGDGAMLTTIAGDPPAGADA
ncbi:insulinase family protein [Methylobacterium sp. E-025]|uniref:M16 family metallopeptidase n=1 Tax=Methylobacterium sp. E-025 TaxID=2836561 RepID=UPI001FBA5D0D|nr:pitrilysin family protein [Methylobacterium sp. E-025]MCJ2111873.1 insulinase family protein [Methylobacterium sp. E-025]